MLYAYITNILIKKIHMPLLPYTKTENHEYSCLLCRTHAAISMMVDETKI